MSHHSVVQLEVGEIDRVKALWLSMVATHREVAGEELPIRPEEETWRRRRAQYVDWVGEGGTGRMFVAVPAADPGAEPAGYILLTVGPPGPTWEIGELAGDIESLAVAPEARGEGIGTMLMDHCRALLREEGIEYWTVAVVEANAGASRLYERVGFHPFYRTMMGKVDP